MYRVLIVDDNAIHIKTILCYLNELNITDIETAGNGVEGYEKYLAFQPHIIITDVVMPLMDGLKMTQKIRQTDEITQIIFMSCYEEFDYVKTALKNQVATYILKPVSMEKFAKEIQAVSIRIQEREKHEMLFIESLDAFRENFLYELSYSTGFNYDDFHIYTKNLRLEGYKWFIVARFYLLNSEETESNLLDIYKMRSAIKEKLAKDIPAITIIENNMVVALFLSTIESSTDFEDIVKNKLSAFVGKYYPDRIMKIGLSKTFDSIMMIKTMLVQATEVLENSLFQDNGEVSIFDGDNINGVVYQVPIIISELKYIIESGDIEKIDQFLENYCSSGRQKSALNSFCFIIVTIIQLILFEKKKDTKDFLGNYAIAWNKLDAFDTILDVRQWIKNIIISAVQIINDDKQNNYERITNDIINNINRSLTTVTNIGELTANLYISPNYAKSIFKKVTGKTIFEYILNKKVDEAKKLLKDPYIKIYQVADMMGYKSKAHFSDIFKRYTGMTPKEYQQRSGVVRSVEDEGV